MSHSTTWRHWLLLAFAWSISGCAGQLVSTPAPSLNPVFEPELYLDPESRREDIDVYVTDRTVIRTADREPLLRVRFSFVAYRDYIGEGDVHRATGALFFPIGNDSEPRLSSRDVLITEFPPGSAAGGFSFHEEYGHRPAVELGVAAAVVHLRGGIARELRDFVNPSDDRSSSFRSERQFALSMLHTFQETNDVSLLYEYNVSEAWLRAIAAVRGIVNREASRARRHYILVGEGYGALGAAQAAALDEDVRGLVYCGWPLDWTDQHFATWRRWERQARLDPFRDDRPIPFDDSRALVSFLSSSFQRPDPECPSCPGTGERWRTQFNYLDLRKRGLLAGVGTLAIFGDSDPDLPIDLELRASVPPEEIDLAPGFENGEILSLGTRVPGRFSGPFARFTELPFDDLTYLRESDSRLANPEASAATRAWVQHLAGYRDLPRARIRETFEDGQIVIEVRVLEGNATTHDVELYLTDIGDRDDSDFRFSLHRDKPEPMRWRRFDAHYEGVGGERGVHRWKLWLPTDRSRNRAYYVVIRDRSGALEAAHSLPIRTFWHLGDPARGAIRF